MSLRDVFVQIRKRCPGNAGLGAVAGALAPTCSQRHLEEGLFQNQFSVSSAPLTATEQQVPGLRPSQRRLTALCLLPPAPLGWASRW